MTPSIADTGHRRVVLFNQLIIFSIIFGLCSTWVLMSEFIQGMQEGWQKPWFILYVIHCGYALNLIIYWVLYGLRTRDWLLRGQFAAILRYFDCRHARGTPLHISSVVGQPFQVPMRQIVGLSVVLSLLSAFVGYSW